MAAQQAVTATIVKQPPPGFNIVAGALDDNMVYPALVWAHSLDRTASRPVHFMIGYLEASLSVGHREFLHSSLAQLAIDHQFIELDNDQRFITQGHISPTTFTKFLLADRIITTNMWIDIDIVATPQWDSLFDLIDSSPAESLLVVAQRHDGRGKTTHSSGPDYGLAFNAGVLGWPNRERLPWSEALDQAALVDTQEQHLFNSLYADRTLFVSEEFNSLAHHHDSLKSRKVPHLLHFAGAHKPWHLPRRFSKLCTGHRCPWSFWFDAEKLMLDEASELGLAESLHTLQDSALRSGEPRFSADHRGREFLRLLSRLGPWGWVPVLMMRPWSQFIPQGTHPLHKRARGERKAVND